RTLAASVAMARMHAMPAYQRNLFESLMGKVCVRVVRAAILGMARVSRALPRRRILAAGALPDMLADGLAEGGD
ncbi:MAG TPA: hypothetical protein VK731_04285, partial [Candidatus Cybelea sp.]|nr:hypothetical protein [Candidatus Cybelea sp.]